MRQQYFAQKSLEDVVTGTLAMMRREAMHSNVYIIGTVANHQVTLTLDDMGREVQIWLVGTDGPAKRAVGRALDNMMQIPASAIG